MTRLQNCRRYRNTISFPKQSYFSWMVLVELCFTAGWIHKLGRILRYVCSSILLFTVESAKRLLLPESVWHILEFEIGNPIFVLPHQLTDLSTRCRIISVEFTSHNFQGCGQMLFLWMSRPSFWWRTLHGCRLHASAYVCCLVTSEDWPWVRFLLLLHWFEPQEGFIGKEHGRSSLWHHGLKHCCSPGNSFIMSTTNGNAWEERGGERERGISR